MKKLMGMMGVCLLAILFFAVGTLISDRQRLHDNLIRMHIVANSNSAEDQFVKLQVRDAVIDSLASAIQSVKDVNQANEYLREKLPYIRKIAEDTLHAFGFTYNVDVQLCEEPFDIRSNNSFTVPSGVYHALKIVIGDGAGENWWCVAFPGLCIIAAGEDIETVTAAAGFPRSLQKTLTGAEACELRFGILEVLGELENILFAE